METDSCRNGHVRTSVNTRIGKDGSKNCRTCQHEAVKRYKAKNPDREREGDRLRRQAIQEWLRELKLASGCVDCGYNANVDALEWDHVDPEQKLCWVGRNNTWASVKREMDKCVVRCANCHKIRTMEQHRARYRKAS